MVEIPNTSGARASPTFKLSPEPPPPKVPFPPPAASGQLEGCRGCVNRGCSPPAHHIAIEQNVDGPMYKVRVYLNKIGKEMLGVAALSCRRGERRKYRGVYSLWALLAEGHIIQ